MSSIRWSLVVDKKVVLSKNRWFMFMALGTPHN